MILIENMECFNIARAVYSARNALSSWDRSDSDMATGAIGPADLHLMRKLCKAGTEHRKFARQIMVSVDITAPLYWWKEFDTYKVGVTANSCSTMHKLHTRDLTLQDFSTDHMVQGSEWLLTQVINQINWFRRRYENTRNKDDWWQMIQLLPSSYNQKRTVTMNYENVLNIIRQREFHKLDEWRELCKVLKTLPLIPELMEALNDEQDA